MRSVCAGADKCIVRPRQMSSSVALGKSFPFLFAAGRKKKKEQIKTARDVNSKLIHLRFLVLHFHPDANEPLVFHEEPFCSNQSANN